MAYEFLQPFFQGGEGGDGTPKALTFDQLEQAMTAANADIVDLSAGGYVTQKEHKEREEELQKQLDDQTYSAAIQQAGKELKFSSKAAEKVFYDGLMQDENRLKISEGKVVGFSDYVDSYKASDPGIFAAEEKPSAPAFPYFGGVSGGSTGDRGGGFQFGLTQVRGFGDKK